MNTLISQIGPEALAAPFIYRATAPTDGDASTGGLPGEAADDFAPPADDEEDDAKMSDSTEKKSS
jgi:hypothetical protein